MTGMTPWSRQVTSQSQTPDRQPEVNSMLRTHNFVQYHNKFSRQGELAHAICSGLPYLEPNKSSQCSSHPITWMPMLMLFSHLRLGLTSFLFPSIFPSNSVCNPSPMRATWPIHLISLDLITRITFDEEHNLWNSRYVISPSTTSVYL